MHDLAKQAGIKLPAVLGEVDEQTASEGNGTALRRAKAERPATEEGDGAASS